MSTIPLSTSSTTLGARLLSDEPTSNSLVDSESVFDQNKNSEDMEEREYVENIKNGAAQLGFIWDKFAKWLSSISDDIVATQTLEYWLRSYVSELETNAWNEDISPSAWLTSRFAITPEKANTIVNSVSEEHLQCQTPQYWIIEWIKQQTNPASPEFETFIENEPADTLVTYVTYVDSLRKEIPNILIVDKEPHSDDAEELNLLLSEQSRPSSNNHTYYFHSTSRNYAESIKQDGIKLGQGMPRQDFGSSPSFCLNDKFRYATEWGRRRHPNSCTILVYDIPDELLRVEYSYLDLQQDHEKWKTVVRRSRNGLSSDADNYDAVYGPQITNHKRLIKDRNASPVLDTDKNQLALKERKLAKRVDKQLIGMIIYRTKKD